MTNFVAFGGDRLDFGIGRSERIRTSDPLLPKQVRYQAALRSDRAPELPNQDFICKRELRSWRRQWLPLFLLFLFGERTLWSREDRGVTGVSLRPRVRKTGWFSEASELLSRKTI